MKQFMLIQQHLLDRIKAANLKGLSPERQVAAMRLWADQNVKPLPDQGGTDTDEEMQKFLTDMGRHFGLYVEHPAFQMALKQQKGWKDEWKGKVINKNGKPVNVDVYDTTLQAVLKKIIQDNGRGHHGNTILSGSHGTCLHWPSGSQRIFGTFGNGRLMLIGVGRHGNTNSTYVVDLVLGGTATATT